MPSWGIIELMSDKAKTVQMCVVHPGETAEDGDFTFEMQARYNDARTVKFALIPSDAEKLHQELGVYLKAAAKK